MIVATRVRVPRLAPALTRRQIARLAPTILVRTPERVDERQPRREEPTLWDLARLTPLQRWKRTHTENLREPQPGSGLVVAGDVSLPWRKYVEAAAHNQTPPAIRYAQRAEFYEHTISACESHVMVPLGQQALSTKAIRAMFLSHRHVHVPHATHLHETVTAPETYLADGDRYTWHCRRCDQFGWEPYDVETLGRATGVVWYGCLKCGPTSKAQIGRRMFLKGSMVSFVVGGLIGVPFVPPANGANDIVYCQYNASNPTGGAGTSVSPYGSLNTARQNIQSGDGDTIRMRGGQDYAERLDAANEQFPSGTSWGNPTTIEADEGHLPLVKPTDTVTASVLAFTRVEARQYLQFTNILWDNGNSGGSGHTIRWGASADTTAGAHHIRFLGGGSRNFSLNASGSGSGVGGWGTYFNEFINFDIYTGGNVAPIGQAHCWYLGGADHLVQGAEMYDSGGYGYHHFLSNTGDARVTLNTGHRCVIRRAILRNTSAGHIISAGNDQLAYALLVYDNTQRGLRLNAAGGVSANNLRLFNCTLVGNNGGNVQILHSSGNTNTVLQNNIAKGSTPLSFISGSIAVNTFNTWNLGITDPVFVNEAARDLHLQLSSQCRDSGTNVAGAMNTGSWPESPARDYDEVARPVNASFDLGALEYSVAGGVLTISVSDAISVTDTAGVAVLAPVVVTTPSHQRGGRVR